MAHFRSRRLDRLDTHHHQQHCTSALALTPRPTCYSPSHSLTTIVPRQTYLRPQNLTRHSFPMLPPIPPNSQYLETVRRNNRKTDNTNRQILPNSVFAQVHPKMKPDGTYPIGFEIPMTVEEIESMSKEWVEGVLEEYGLLNEVEVRTMRKWELAERLFEFLGADGIARGY